MPPRYAYWTILIDEQPTAFRAASQEDLMPTFKRLKDKNASAKMMWFQNGKLWPSRVDAQEAMRARGEAGRRGDTRQGGFRSRTDRRSNVGDDFSRPGRRPNVGDDFGRPVRRPNVGDDFSRPERLPDRERKPRREHGEKLEWKPKGSAGESREKLDWKPKGEFTPAPKRTERLEWKPKGSFAGGGKPSAYAKGTADRQAPGPKPSAYAKATADRQVPSPKPRAGRDKNWRPGGEHRDPRQKYKDAKKAKWTRFKQAVRKRWEAKPGKPPGKKRRDDE